ncbi:hypothetical protein GCM10009624_30800 [Gordonia sinesedis]
MAVTDVDRRYIGRETPYAAVLSAAGSAFIYLLLWPPGMLLILLFVAVAASTMTMGGATRRVAMGVVIGGLGIFVAAIVHMELMIALY